MNRRTLLATISAGFLFTLLIPYNRIRRAFLRMRSAGRLESKILATLASAAECVYPEDHEPGAQSLGILNFLTLQINQDYYRHAIPGLKKLAQSLDREAQKRGGLSFGDMDRTLQDAIVEAVNSGSLDTIYPGIQRNLHTLIDITLEGCFADSVHGGNRERQAWIIMQGGIRQEWFDV